jgi:hypothetical protein
MKREACHRLPKARTPANRQGARLVLRGDPYRHSELADKAEARRDGLDRSSPCLTARLTGLSTIVVAIGYAVAVPRHSTLKGGVAARITVRQARGVHSAGHRGEHPQADENSHH